MMRERSSGGNEVAARLCRVIDLHAADAQYHVPCYNRPSIMEPLEDALRCVLSMMAENAKESWTLYVMYLAASGTVSRRQFVSNATAHFGDELLVLHIEGCDSVVGFKASLGKVIKIVKISQSMGDDDELEKLVRNIRREVMAKPRNMDYTLRECAGHKVIESTSATLARLVSSLVPGGAITKPSLTLAQCIQQHIGGTNINLTILGLAVKLHHKHDRSELVKTLNEHGITSSYDEVLRFRKSVAKFVSHNQSDYHNELGLSMEIGPIFSWAGNYDVYIASPNRTKATHAMVMEFTQNLRRHHRDREHWHDAADYPSTEETRGIMQRLTHQAIQLEHYTGRSKLNPPLLQTKALSAEESQLQSAAVRFSQEERRVAITSPPKR